MQNKKSNKSILNIISNDPVQDTPVVSDFADNIDTVSVISDLNQQHESMYASQMRVEPALNRQLVSFQANKQRAVYRWCKYKEGFSAGLVEYFLERYNIRKGRLLDPFAGSGTALFVASDRGLLAEGIELLPIGQRIIETKQLINDEFSDTEISHLDNIAENQLWTKTKKKTPFNILRITEGAYPPETTQRISQFTAFAQKQKPTISKLLTFALLCVLEEISYTRKDGQYLRWDHRSGRRQGEKIFDKGEIKQFDTAITAKLFEMISDIRSNNIPCDLFHQQSIKRALITLHSGSCLDVLPKLKDKSFNCIVTSPPYCNRYDYTRTYALELAYLGISEEGLIKLRQEMVSCTVENRAKDLLSINPNWMQALDAANKNPLLQAILCYLDSEKENGRLNNNGIPRMVRGYFYEMACVIQECSRVLKKNSPLIMVNDNVRYAGVSISVDIILSEIAENLGFDIESIHILPKGKGNSSQQMGLHGRDPLRKCVYVWRKRK